MTKNVLISDANHGGLILLEEYYKYTQNNLFFYDIYNKLTENEKEYYHERYSVTFLSLDEIKEDEDNYVKINPIHMPPVIKTDYTHHEFVSYLLNKKGYKFKLIQVTGVKGKTTVVNLLRSLLSDFNILTLDSNSLTYNDNILMKNLSITPASIITAINKVKEKGVLNEIDYCIFEVSLGVIPNGFISVLTNIIEDYKIAKNSSSASIAKKSVFTSDFILCDYDSFNKYYKDEKNVYTVSLDNENSDIYSKDIKYNIDHTTFKLNYFDNNYDIQHFALSDFYINNLLFAISVALLVGIHIENVNSHLKNSINIKGRNSYQYINDTLIIEDINPGLNTTSIKKCIDNLKRFNEKYVIILGGDYGITCEEIDETKLSNYLKSINYEKIVFTGELGNNIRKILNKDYLFFDTLNDALTYTLENYNEKLIQIIYRSEYHRNNENIINLIPINQSKED